MESLIRVDVFYDHGEVNIGDTFPINDKMRFVVESVERVFKGQQKAIVLCKVRVDYRGAK